MDLYSTEKTRIDLFDDHSYARTFCDLSDTDISILGANPSSKEFELPDEHIEVDSPLPIRPLDSPFETDHTQLYADLHPTPSMSIHLKRDSKLWIPNVASLQPKLLALLQRCLFSQSLDNYCFPELSTHSRLRKINAKCDLHHRRIARFLRKAMAVLGWSQESCFNFHHWCLTNLTSDLLRLYCDGFTELWRQGKVTLLLSRLNKMLLERNPSWIPHQRVLELLHLSQKQDKSIDMQQSISLSTRSMTTPSHIHRPGIYSFPNYDKPILACLTFPINRKSTRLCDLLHDMGSIGKISVETAEEQASDMLRVRLRFYIRRVLRLLEENRSRSAYLVGFGVASILVLLASIHLYNLERRYERPNVSGIICLGIPLVGLKGHRGSQLDPLLNVSKIPTLFVIGSQSRLGSYRDAANLRSRLIAAQKASIGDNPSQPEITGRGIHVITVNGADHLLRLRPTLRSRWTMTQREVDRRVVTAIGQFICENENALKPADIDPSDPWGS